MKKPRIPILVLITAVFAAFTLGLFLGRNQTQGSVIVSVPAYMQTAPAETTLPAQEPEETTPPVVFPLDINAATKEEFMALPGIGEILAQRIVDYRTANGNFSHVEGLMFVEGIGEKKLEDILDLIVIGG